MAVDDTPKPTPQDDFDCSKLPVLEEEDVSPYTTSGDKPAVQFTPCKPPKPFIYEGKEYKDGDTVKIESVVPGVKVKDQPSKIIQAVLDDKMRCPECLGLGYTSYIFKYVARYVCFSPLQRYSYETCPHVLSQRFRDILFTAVSQHDRSIRFPLKPSPLSTASESFQLEAIACATEHWNEGILYLGPTGTGKTTLMTAQYRQTLWQEILREVLEPTIYKATLGEFIREENAHVTRTLDESYSDKRHIKVERLKNLRFPRVFVDEFDKVGNMTDFRKELIFTLINSMYEKWSKTGDSKENSQFVACTNMTPEQLTETFDDVRVRRLGAMCWRINYFNETIEPPKEQS